MVFGCDICQDVCPWNRNAPVTVLAEFMPRLLSTTQSRVTNENPAAARTEDETLFSPPLESLASLSEAEFREIFRGSPIKRAKWRGLIRNTCIALGNSALAPRTEQHTRIVKLLERLAESPDAVIAEHAHWALARLARAD